MESTTATDQQATEKALRSSADQVSALADKLQDTVRQTQERLTELQREMADRNLFCARNSDAYVHENPWNAECAAMSIGFIVGLILGRR